MLTSEEFRLCVLTRVFRTSLPLFHSFCLGLYSAVIWQGTCGRLQQSDITFRPGRVVTGAYGQCHRSARRSMPGAKLEPTRSRTLHVLFHSWMDQEQILVKVSCSISDALWVNGLLNKLLSLLANFNSVHCRSELLHRLLMMYHIFSLKSIHKRLCIVQCFQVVWSNLVAMGPTRRLIAISRRPGRLVEPSRPLIVLYIRTDIPTIYIPIYTI